ncbi:UDP-N-acetylmuramoyl-L-alanine--D-glutamate ligase [Patescibacteria group bacterium]|nr:UDP-N-acetylmuramoyl-L-alanine--D-glutamate ligase [Patescibacteria group bacterium]
MEFKNKKIIIMGLGLHGGGVGVAKFFYSQGAKLLITDLKSEEQLKESLDKLKNLKIKFVLGKHREEDFENVDLIIKNPDIPTSSPYLEIARENKIPIKNDMEIFFELCPAEIIGVTGTKGKSTVATLICELLKEKYDTVLAGNIGISPLEFLANIKKETKVILELSSFILEDLKKSPHIAVITNLFPDHLNRYKNFHEYVEAKKSIYKYQSKSDILILNEKDPNTKKLSSEAKGKVYFFEGYNAAAAVKVAELLNVSEDNIHKAISNFKGVPSRQEFVAEIKGVKYFNDTTATNPRAVKFAIETFRGKYPDSRIILIAGGEDKRLSYRALAEDIQDNIDFLVLLPGTASDLIERDLKKFKIFKVKSMKEAVKKASDLAKKGDIVLLSPGAASFNLFKNEFDRGYEFKKSIRKEL